jgi:hypothetical protein
MGFSTWSHCAGSELLISYGELSNVPLLAKYGFALEANRHDRLLPPDSLAEAACALSPPRLSE